MTQYRLTVQNQSMNSGSICIFQKNPEMAYNVLPLVWLAKRSAPNTNVGFEWTEEYSFVWGNTGQLRPGAIFNASQMWPADPSGNNQVTFTNNGGGLSFTNPGRGPRPGSLYVMDDATIPSGQAAVGIGMSGSGIFAAQASPNMTQVFATRPSYWIAFGDYQPGQVLDPRNVPNAMEIRFPGGVYGMMATLDMNNNWTIRPM